MPAPAELLAEHGHWIRLLAKRVHRRARRACEVEDLESAGAIKLLECARRWDPSRGATLATYATHRVRGAMLDEVRRCLGVPREGLRLAKRLHQADPTLANGDLRRAGTALALANPASTSLPRPLGADRGLWIEIVDAADGPADAVHRREIAAAVHEAIDVLPWRQRMIVRWYYFEHLTFAEIGERLGVTESRICQLYARLEPRLRRQLTNRGLAR